MTYRYVPDVTDGVRLLMRTRPDNVRKTEYRRMALKPGAVGRPRLEFPTALSMCRRDGYWQAIASPKWMMGFLNPLGRQC